MRHHPGGRRDHAPGRATPARHPAPSTPGSGDEAGSRHDVPVTTAPFWLRTVAAAIDVIPLVTLWALVLAASGLADTSDLPESRWNTFDMIVDLINQRPLFFVPPILVGVGLLFVYTLVCELTLGLTVGKRLLNLTQVDAQGHRPEAIMVLIHNLMRLFSLLPLGAGWIWAAFDTNRRTLHDIVAGVWLVRRTPDLPIPRRPA